jgi:hypothetical protein
MPEDRLYNLVGQRHGVVHACAYGVGVVAVVYSIFIVACLTAFAVVSDASLRLACRYLGRVDLARRTPCLVVGQCHVLTSAVDGGKKKEKSHCSVWRGLLADFWSSIARIALSFGRVFAGSRALSLACAETPKGSDQSAWLCDRAPPEKPEGSHHLCRAFVSAAASGSNDAVTWLCKKRHMAKFAYAPLP